MNLKKFAKSAIIFTLISLALNTAIFSLNTGAFTLPEDLRPINEPFDLSTELKNKGTAFGTVVLLQIISGTLLYFAAPIAIIIVIMSGMTMVMGGADSDKVEQAKKHLTWALVGLGIIILSYSIVKFIIGFAFNAANP
ncbi:hypothetical protein HZC20_02090 [Candidatus Peregrinibacteria bacterium]|nr:hypothetical protein [Candidatus Peregrinibacteria bacterium]